MISHGMDKLSSYQQNTKNCPKADDVAHWITDTTVKAVPTKCMGTLNAIDTHTFSSQIINKISM